MAYIDKNEREIIFKATMKSARMSDKKIRPIIKAIKGKNMHLAISRLSIQNMKGTLLLLKLMKSVINNIPKSSKSLDNIIIKNLYVDKGRFYKRIFTRSQGRVNYIRKKTSHITIIISINNSN